MSRRLTRSEFLTLSTLGSAWLACRPGRALVPPRSSRWIEPGDPGYDTSRTGFNLRIDRHPAAIARCRDEEDVAWALGRARERGLSVAVRSGGHSLEGFSTNDGGLVLDLGAMDAIRWLDETTVSVGPGVRLAALYDALLPRGRLIPTGSCGSVGLGGLTLGGGYGFFSRALGLTCDSLVRARFVDALGRRIETTSDPELDWAARGGLAANAAVATELVFRTHPAPATIDTRRFRFRHLDVARARVIADVWCTETPTLGRDLFSAFILNGETLTIVLKRSGPDDAGFDTTTDALRALADDVSVVDARPLADAVRASYGITSPTRFRCGSAGFYRDTRELATVLERLIPVVLATRSLIFQVNTLGGAIAESPVASAFPYRDRPYLAELQSYWETPEPPDALRQGFERGRAVLSEFGPRAHYASYPDLAIPDPQRAYFGASLPRLEALRRRLDPERLFRHPQSVSG